MSTTTSSSRRMTPVDEQLAVLMHGTEYGDEQLRATMERELRQRLDQDRPLRVYCGYDPTRVDLHLGHSLSMRKLRQFQDFGHDVTFLVGSFTSLVGDPSGRDKTRPMLTPEEVEANAKSYTDQAFRILDPERTTVSYNAEWLSKVDFEGVLRLSSSFTVAQFLRRDSFARRYEKGEPIYISELMYALMQAYDAAHLETDVQVGGSDQLFNLMAGRTLQQERGQPPQIVLTLPILVGTDGREKMSKSLGNYIGLDEPPNDVFGKVMSIPDECIVDYFTLVTDQLPDQVAAIESALASGDMRPMDAKKQLAFEVTESLYSAPEAQEAAEYFESTIQRRETPEEMPEFSLDGARPLHQVLVEYGLAASNGEVRRLVAQGGIALNGEPVSVFTIEVAPGDEIRVGKHRFLRIVDGSAAGGGDGS